MRGTALYREAETLYCALRRPGSGAISDAAEISTNGTQAVFAGTMVEALRGAPPTRICLTELATGETRVLTFGPNVDRLPKFSPDGRRIAFLSDRDSVGDFQLYILELGDGVARATARVNGWVEYLHWSPDGRLILLGVAGHGADVSGGQGAVTSGRGVEDAPAWMPRVETVDKEYGWRRAWVYDVATNGVRQASSDDSNVWEAAWCGNDAIAAIVSPGPAEGLWYSARLHIIGLRTASRREVYAPGDQLGWPAASPSGKHLAIVEAICSDRGIVAGDLHLMETVTGNIRRLDTRGVDITHAEWRSDRHLLLAGLRGFETVVGIYDTATTVFTEVWVSRELTTGGFGITIAGINETGDCVLVGEGFLRPPEVAVIRQGDYQPVKSFDCDYADHAKAIQAVECITWQAPDGLDIQGWLLLPHGACPHPLITNIHGGPVGHARPRWLGRTGINLLMLLKRGYAILFANPRGSSGRGQEFARKVKGDMGGAETADHLSGLDYLVERGVADPERIGVTGGSHGGFMTSWLITQDSRFAAAVSVAPVTNQVTAHLISNIPHFVTLFLNDAYTNLGGKYYCRSPVMQADKVKTPTLNVCGALDRCTPPGEAIQFHNALVEGGTHSVLVIYPEEGHGIRRLPASIDYAARFVAWFVEHMPAGNAAATI